VAEATIAADAAGTAAATTGLVVGNGVSRQTPIVADDSCRRAIAAGARGLSGASSLRDSGDDMRLEHRLRDLIQVGRLTVVMPDDDAVSFGPAQPAPGLDLVVQLHGGLTPFKLGWRPDRELGEAYADGRLIMVRGSIADLMELIYVNLARQPRPHGPFERLRRAWIASFEESKTGGGDRGAAILRHYGKEDLYRAFLGDEDRQFSVAYFDRPYATIDRAQAAGRRHLAAKLRLEPGMKVLDLGCGWGALAIWLARTFDVEVTGYTLSAEQLLHAREAVRRAALCDKVKIESGDFRAVGETYDRIVVTGAFEHVGMPQYRAYFDTLKAALAPDGIALLHTTAHGGPPRPMNPWVRRRLFPGSHVPALEVVVHSIEKAGLCITDLEILRLHGAETLRLWREALLQRQWLLTGEDEKRRRSWELFLAAAEMAFRYGDLMTLEAQIVRTVGTAPVMRADLAQAEAALEAKEAHLVRPSRHVHAGHPPQAA
jgi:cyclopropane-fatty-acyl-phospholipid synthase